MIEVEMNQSSSLILDLFGGTACDVSKVGDVEKLITDKSITVDMRRVEARLGIEVPAFAGLVLQRMGFGLQRDGHVLQVAVPSHRHDVSLFEDISEEYARVIGFDKIPAVLPPLTTIQPRQVDNDMGSAVSLGFWQVINYAFISRE